MIWMVARNKKHIPKKRRRFNNQVANVYMAICLSMLPVTASSFCAVKIWGAEKGFIYKVYFLSWLVASLFFTLKKNINFTNKYCLISGGGILSILVPFCNGFTTGLWPWISYPKGFTEVLFIDLLFFFLGILSLWVAFFKLTSKRAKSKFEPNS